MAAADGSVVLTGRTQGGWDGPSEGDFDFMAVMFKGGAELWRLQVCMLYPFFSQRVVGLGCSAG